MDVCRRMSKAYSDRYTHDDEKKVDNESHIDTTMKKMYHAPACVLLHRHACDCGCMHPWSYACAGGRVTLCSAMSLPLSCMWTLSSFANFCHLLPTSTWISMDFHGFQHKTGRIPSHKAWNQEFFISNDRSLQTPSFEICERVWNAQIRE